MEARESSDGGGRWSRLAETNKTVWSSVETVAPATAAAEATMTTTEAAAMSGGETVAVVN
ncbi:hypothetical protein DEO72_LG2g1134 [Vigna unguiculata]|uniref:Uncharacterized protein n=1 Tax=Vigna unguiculata TaxID=3917 RepID=A0A4D6KZZ5_VIGUN|nr:hypothetical protein DEO72_LG2g1134 [Vigna unguiculata]